MCYFGVFFFLDQRKKTTKKKHLNLKTHVVVFGYAVRVNPGDDDDDDEISRAGNSSVI